MSRAEPMSQHGWFADPEEPGRLRMWDGRAWTSLTKYPAHDEPATEAPAHAGPVPSGPLPSGPLPSSPASPAQKPTHVQEAPTRSPSTALWHRPEPQPARSVVADPEVEPTLSTFAAANRISLITLGVAVVYMIVASAVGFAFLGILPALLTGYAYRLRERMAPFAALASASAIVIGLVLLAR